MSLFKNSKRKTKAINILGVEHILTEPSALGLTDYYEYMREQHNLAKKETSDYVKAGINTRVSLKLVAHCLFQHFNGTESVSNIHRELCNSITDFDEINKLNNAAEEVSGLKILETDKSEEVSQES